MISQKDKVLYLSMDDKNIADFKNAVSNVCEIFVAKSTLDAIEILKANSIAVIFAEENLGDVTGLQFFESILIQFPFVKRILIIDTDDADALIKAINKAHIFRSFTLPFNVDELKQSITDATKIFQTEKQNQIRIQQLQKTTLKNERLINFLSKCAPKHIADEATTDTLSILTPDKNQITILLIKIDNINELMKKASPERTLDYLRKFLLFSSAHIEEHKGNVNKIIGSDIIALFGSPVSYLNNQLNAVFAGFAILENIKQFNLEISNQFNFNAHIHISIHTGFATIGNMGTDIYVYYTAIGDTVDKTEQLMTIKQEEPFFMLVSDEVFQLTKDDIQFEKVKYDHAQNDIYKAITKKMKPI